MDTEGRTPPLQPESDRLMKTMLTPQQIWLAYATIASLGAMGIIHAGPRLLPRAAQLLPHALSFLRCRPKNSIDLGGLILTDEARMRHTHIIGSTGSGKTVLMEHLIYRDLARGYGALIIDPKGERDLYDRVKSYCRKIGRLSDLHLLSATYIEESARWNPCRLGSVSELQTKFFCSAKYEHSFYAKAAELALLDAFTRADQGASGAPFLLVDLARALDSLSNGGKDENLKGLFFDIQNLARGEWSAILGVAEKPGLQEEVSLLDVTRRNEILFVDLPTEGKAVQSARLGSLLLQEISLLSGIRKRMPSVKSDRPFAVYVDEFDAFATDPFVTFLNKGRSSGFMIHLAHQTLSDLDRVSPTFLGQVMGNINNRFIFRLDLAEDAERISRLFGTKTVVRKTFQAKDGKATGVSSNREAQEFRIHPDSIKGLLVGECVVSIKTDRVLEQIRVPRLDVDKLPAPKVPVDREALAVALGTSGGHCVSGLSGKLDGSDVYDRLAKGEQSV